MCERLQEADVPKEKHPYRIHSRSQTWCCIFILPAFVSQSLEDCCGLKGSLAHKFMASMNYGVISHFKRNQTKQKQKQKISGL